MEYCQSIEIIEETQHKETCLWIIEQQCILNVFICDMMEFEIREMWNIRNSQRIIT